MAGTGNSRLLGALDRIERVGNRLPDPITLFALLALSVVLASGFAAYFGVSAVHPATGAEIRAVNLVSSEGLRRMLTEGVRNFTAFPPLGLVLVVIIGIGVAERSGLVAAALVRLVRAVPKPLLTAAVVFAGVMSSLAADAGYVVLTPLGAMLFGAVGRHPMAGLAAAFAGVSGGFSANLLLTSLDPLLAGLSQEAARLLDRGYVVDATANYYFMFASVFLVVAIGTWVTTRYAEPRLGAYKAATDLEGEVSLEAAALAPSERRGLLAAGTAAVALTLLLTLLVIPPGAPLRDPKAVGGPLLVELRPLFDSLVMVLMLGFLALGVVYGVFAKTIRSDRDVAKMASESVGMLGSYIVLAFMAAQFIAYFGWSNLGIIMAITGASGLKAVGLSGVPLLLMFVVLSASINLFIASSSAKWAVMAPVFIPMLMLMGYSPEVVQAAYRVGDSATNIVTPLMPYLPVVIAFAQKYDPKAGLGTLVSLMLPYSLAFLIGWLGLFGLWVGFDLPLGPGAPLNYQLTPTKP